MNSPSNKEPDKLVHPMSAGIYLHIPFCKQACSYCNFHFSTSLKYKAELLQAMMKEIEMQREYLKNIPIQTIYFGGGTPSLLTSSEINYLIEHIYKYYEVGSLTECTLEANPDDLSRSYLNNLQATPINRLSIGVQSFKQADLLYMNRAHNAQEADYAIKAAQDAGYTNLSIDLIYGTPQLTDAEWKNNLNIVAQLAVPHFSAYALTVEEKTALHASIKNKKTQPTDPEQAANQFEILMEHASAKGYEHYEISNFALPGKYAVHNTNYWRALPYLGIGPSAHSFNGTGRRWNIANNALYTKSILAEHKLLFEEEVLTTIQKANEYIMTSIRTMWGCDLQLVEQLAGHDNAQQLLVNSYRHQEKGYLIHKDNKLTLTNKGKLYADRIASDLFFEEMK